MFTLYVNDFPEYVDMYADDRTLQIYAKDITTLEDQLTEMLAKVAEWMKINKLTLHLGKTKAQLIGYYHCDTKTPNVNVECNVLRPSTFSQIIRYTL